MSLRENFAAAPGALMPRTRPPLSALARGLDRIASGVRPVIDTVYPLTSFRAGVDRLESRDVFGKILIEL